MSDLYLLLIPVGLVLVTLAILAIGNWLDRRKPADTRD